MMKQLILSLFLLTYFGYKANAAYILIPMDDKQRNHLKAYGVTFYVLQKDIEAYWMLNYRGGSFAFPHNPLFEDLCKIRDVSYEVIADAQFAKIRTEIANPEVNQEVVKLEVAPKIAVYTPTVDEKGNEIQPWDDAVTLVLTYAEIPYTTIYDKEVLEDKLAEYDWLHLHHEDFTGQYGKFYSSYGSAAWYKQHVQRMETLATSLGYQKVSQLKLDVVKKIREFVIGGGFMFAMCSATDTYDIALAADGIDICANMYDGDPQDPNAQSKLNFEKTFAFQNFKLKSNPLEYEYSTIDRARAPVIDEKIDYFTLFDFSAKWDPIPTMLTQCQSKTVKGFMGQTTGFMKEYLKPNVLILGESKALGETRYIHGEQGKGFWTYYGGHDPEDYRHYVQDPPTDLNLHPNSAAYRLILNNILFPAARKQKQKT
jgi:hypothetical protein